MKKFFGLLTDFGFDFAVASIKGVLLQTFPDAHIIDIDHGIEKFSVINGAFVIDKSYPFLPQDTIFLCVVDPGVGTNRDILCIKLASQWFIGPNNGFFHYLFEKEKVKIYTLKQHLFSSASVTFHGRDIFAPAAIRLAQGDMSILAPVIDTSSLIHLNNLGNQIDTGVITYIDSFGNIKTNIAIASDCIPGNYMHLVIDGLTYEIPFTRTFTGVNPGELLCYEGSNATLEIAVNQDSAQKKLAAKIGNRIYMVPTTREANL